MVGLGGLELPTSPLSGVRSNQLSYRPSKLTHFVCLLTVYNLYSTSIPVNTVIKRI